MEVARPDIIDAIYAAATQPKVWGDILSLMQTSFDSVASSFTLQRYDDGGVMLGVTSGYGDKWLHAYQTEFGARNPFVKSKSSFQLGHVLTDTLFDDGRETGDRFERTCFFNEWVRPQGFQHAMGSALDLQGDRLLIFALWREQGARSFSAEDVERQTELSRHLKRAANLSRQFEAIRRDLTVVQSLQGERGCGVVTLDRHGHVRDLNAEASRVVAAADGLTIRGNRLTAFLPADTAAIRKLIHAASGPTLVGSEEFGPALVHREDGRLPLKIKLIAMPRQTSPFPDDDAVAMIVVIQDLQSDRMAMDRRIGEVSRRFGLSAGEQSIVKHLLGARNLREAAERAGIGYETARTQIKAAFSKTNTNSQIELLLLIGHPDA